MENPNADVFVYTGEGGVPAPHDVVRVLVDPSVTSIPARAFYERKKLTEVELCEGVVEIGEKSFSCCDHSITRINIPNSLRRIKDYAFSHSLRCPIRLHDDIESIGKYSFSSCIFTNLRVPPLITVIPDRMLLGCRSMFSLELPKNVMEINGWTFYFCYCLRNVAFPPNAVIGGDRIFVNEDMEANNDEFSDLQLLFGNSNARIIWALQHRFDGLPIHCIVYYQSYNHGVLQNLIAAINSRSGQSRTLRPKLNPTGNQQDCLGMTPLHILTCSSVHDLEVYHLIVENYPTNLITEDRWGALPLLYAFWGAAPTEIIQFLLESYQSLYPGYEFNWTMMVETMGRCDTPKESIENLLCVKQIHFPEQPTNWEYLLDKFAQPSNLHLNVVLLQERMQFLFMCGMSDRVEALSFKVWRDCISNMIQTADFNWGGNWRILPEIRSKLAHFECEFPKLKEATTILELALWKTRLDDNCIKENKTLHQKKIKVDETSLPQHCRITCGADVIIGHVLPFLITV
jgi:hypothetical protein